MENQWSVIRNSEHFVGVASNAFGRGARCASRADECVRPYAKTSSRFLYRKTGCHPALLALGIMRNVGVTHGRQFTGGVFAGVSMRIGTVGHDLNGLVGQQLRCKLPDFVGRKVHCSGEVSLAVAFGSKSLNHLDRFFAVYLR